MKNKKVPLKMSDELHGEIVDEANFLKSKLYSIRKESGVKQSAKGVNRAVKSKLHHDLFMMFYLVVQQSGNLWSQ